MSDLNQDGVIDDQDLELFRSAYLSQDGETINWCNFYKAATTNERFFRRHTANRSERYTRLLNFIADSYDCPHTPRVVDKSDLDSDGAVDLADLSIFSSNYLETHWKTIDWCLFHENTLAGIDFKNKKVKYSEDSTNDETSVKDKKRARKGHKSRYFLEHFQSLLRFVNDEFDCGGSEPPPPDTLLEHEPRDLSRIAGSTLYTDGYYITDPRVGSVFIYDADLVLKAEIKGLNRPLGVAVDRDGNVLVGNDGRDNIEVYDPATGKLLAVFGEGLVNMPTAITIDALGNIYVTDSKTHNVKVFDPAYSFTRLIGRFGIGNGELNFPVDTEVIDSSGEVLVADQGNIRIQIYDLQGNWLRTITHEGVCGWWRCTSPPLKMVQGLDTDSLGRLHVLDNFVATVMIFDPADGTYLNSYGEYGEGAGFLVVPRDVLISNTDASMVTPGDGARIEVMVIPW